MILGAAIGRYSIMNLPAPWGITIRVFTTIVPFYPIRSPLTMLENNKWIFLSPTTFLLTVIVVTKFNYIYI